MTNIDSQTLFRPVEKTVDRRVHTGIGDVSIVREVFHAPFSALGPAKPSHHLQLSLLPFPQAPTGCFEDLWGPHRFERIGPLFLLPAEARLRARSACRMQHSLVCDLPPLAIRAWFDTDFAWSDRQLTGSLDIASTKLRRLMHAIIAELNQPGFASDAMVELLTAQVCVTLARHFGDIAGKLQSDGLARSGGLAPWRLRAIDECLEANSGAATIASLAGHCGMSPRHLSRAFRASSGRSLGEHIARRRIEIACRMLAAGASIKQTAFATGFSAPSNFASAFRRATGTTPRLFRDNGKKVHAAQPGGNIADVPAKNGMLKFCKQL